MKDKKYQTYRSGTVVRNPFSRLYSAWNDKFRHGIFLERMKNIPGHSWNQTMERKKNYLDFFYPAISIFENAEETAPPPFRNVTFKAFLKYISVFDEDESKFDWHWRSYNYFCSPCMFEISDIVHLEDLDNEAKFLFDKWKMPEGLFDYNWL